MIAQAISKHLTDNGIKHHIDHKMHVPSGSQGHITIIVHKNPTDNGVHHFIHINIGKSKIALTTYTPLYNVDTKRYSSQKHWDLANPQLLQELTQSIAQP